nr:AAA-associated domain-containing protein [Thermogemmatispora tikiterensis]
MASILLIFTSQAWNMTFSFYHAVLTLPRDLVDVCRLLRLRPWQRFLKLELAAATIGLVWNSMMSWAGGWFFLMASEQFSLGDRSFRLPGLGSYLQLAADRGDPWALTLGLLTLIGLIVLLDVCLWRPLVAWAERFTLEEQAEAAPPRSLVLDLLRASPALHWLRQHVGQPLWEAVAQLLNRLQPQPAGTSALLPGLQPAHHERPRSWLRRGGALLILGLLGLLALWVCWQGGQLLVQVPPATWLRTEEGDPVLTAVGRQLAEADVQEEKRLFRQQALARIALLRRIAEDLAAAPGHRVDEERYLERLREHFSEGEAEAQLQTIIDLGRYAEIFTYQEEAGVFALETNEEAAEQPTEAAGGIRERNIR